MKTQCCIAGGGPAGMMLGFLLARSGVDVVVLEKHADFFRDFRGDTIHPSTLDVMAEIGLLDDFLRLPHDQVGYLSGVIGNTTVRIADFRHLPTRCKYLVLMPQWDFLNFLSERAKRYPAFHVLMNAQATDLTFEGDRVTGVIAQTAAGREEIQAQLVVAADGRTSTIRDRAGMHCTQLGAPMDILWMRISRAATDPEQTFGTLDRGRIFISLNRNAYWQCGYVIPKGTFEALQREGIAAFRERIAQIAPFLANRVDELQSWDDVKLLTVAVDRLERWYRPGLLCIGDAAHAMSPIGGVGVNLAIQDAVAASNMLAAPLRRGYVRTSDLEAVQRRRMFPTRVTQGAQLFIQRRVITPILGNGATTKPPAVMRVLSRFPILQRIPAWLVGVGVRPEHVRTREIAVR
ncbi:MAG TPA: FAD-dependent oxidoreductase [Candidatus Baltobacteraceae bacterium]|nr:FAD-dependent oxidoreductase [Candidatus Baltobacteraceae bacterium]